MTLAQEPSFGLSPSNSSPDDTNLMYEDDSKDQFDFGNDFEEIKPKKSNGRKGSGPGAADKRATHNAIERARRESLNGRFMTLAEALPAMANVKRPSKSIIVNKALDFVYEAQVKEHALIKENNDLRRQVDQLRARLGMPPLPPPAPLPGATGMKSPASPTKGPSPTPISTVDDMGSVFSQQEFTASPTGSDMQQQQQQQHQPSPVSSFSSEHTPSPAISAPPVSFSGLPLPSQAPNLNAFNAATATASQQQTLSPFQIGGYPSPSPTSTGQSNGAMNPAQNLLSQQHTLLLAAHIQQQQQVAQQHQLDLQQFVSAGMIGGGVNAMAWTGLGHGAMWPSTSYGALENYQAFLA